jgi:hypothetical protein
MLTRMGEEDWTVTLEAFHAARSRRGDKGRDDRRFLEALHYSAVHNVTWRALPAEFGNWNSGWKRFWRLSCNSAAMSLHLAEISAMVAPGRRAVLLLDQAGWHLSGMVEVPPNITLLPLPPKCPELNVMENVWQVMRDMALQPRLPGLRRHRRPPLPRLEQARRSALAHRVHRPPRLGPWVRISGIWY